jgi:Protein of unknown function (DUF1769)
MYTTSTRLPQSIMPRLSVIAGLSLDALVPITVNSGIPHTLYPMRLKGRFLHISRVSRTRKETSYRARTSTFNGRTVKASLGAYSLKVHCLTLSPFPRWRALAYTGRFLRPISADDVLFGNTFDHPLKLPWGSGAALKFMQYISLPLHSTDCGLTCS